MHNKFNDDNYHIPQIKITRCKNETFNGVCKSDSEIDQFLEQKSFWLAALETSVDKEVFS